VASVHLSGDPRYFWARPSPLSLLPYYSPAVSESTRIDGAWGTLLDPYISPAAAENQVRRVARARGMAEEAVRSLVHGATQAPLFRVIGTPRVDVLVLNLALSDAADATSASWPEHSRQWKS
jgi:K+-transporting ATPase c subunit